MAESSKPSRRRRALPEKDPREESLTPDPSDEDLTPDGNRLASEGLADPGGDALVADDENEAEELLTADDTVDDTPGRADPGDVVIDDEEQLDEATDSARKARSPRPVRRNQTVAPVRKSKPTPKREEARTPARKRTTPVQFVKQSVGELRKVVWPSGSTTRQYFFVVLVFVLFIMFIVAGLDALFGWLLLLWLG